MQYTVRQRVSNNSFSVTYNNTRGEWWPSSGKTGDDGIAMVQLTMAGNLHSSTTMVGRHKNSDATLLTVI